MAAPPRTIMSSARTAAGVGPVPGQERIDAIDVLRGVAILGILIVNMGLFNHAEDLPAHGVVDRIILFVAQEKFKTLFSLLFGLGLAVQMLRAEARGARFLPLYARRLAVLFLIGIAHSLLVWDGDILHDYAQLGVLLLPFRHRSARALLLSAALLFAIPVVFYGLTTYSAITGHTSPAVQKWVGYEEGEDGQDSMDDMRRIYSRGTYGEQVALRARELPRDLMPDSDDAFILAMFLLGLLAGRRKIFHDVAANRGLLRRVQRWGFLIGIVGNAAFAIGGSFDPDPDSVVQNVGRLCLVFGAPALTLWFASTIALVTQDETWRRRLAPLAAVGRMALSNYLLQSLVCTAIFYSFGFELFGRVSAALGLLLTVAIFLIQIPISVWWLRRFRFGPVEWLWRSLTYWQRQPMRVSERP
jgi:uncharacterized protein